MTDGGTACSATWRGRSTPPPPRSFSRRSGCESTAPAAVTTAREPSRPGCSRSPPTCGGKSGGGAAGGRKSLDPTSCLWATTGSAEDSALAAERDRAVRSALAALPETQREVIELHRFEHLSFPEIAEALGEGVEAVKSRAFRGYKALRTMLMEIQP